MDNLEFTAKCRDAYWEGYRAGLDWHLHGGSRPDNPWDTRQVDVTQDEQEIADSWQAGFDEAGQDS